MLCGFVRDVFGFLYLHLICRGCKIDIIIVNFMKRVLLILLLLCARMFCPTLPLFAGEFKDSGASFAVDFPSGWTSGRSDDPTVVLKLERGKSFFEFARLDSELSDYYLKARVKEQVDSFRSKGNSLAGDVRQAGMHGGSTAYYTSYDSMGVQVYIAFFTHNGLSYAISASGLDDDDFRNAVSTIRKPGEIIEVPKPKKIKVVRKKRQKPEEVAQLFKEEEPVRSTMTLAAVVVPTEPVTAAPVETPAPAVKPAAEPAAEIEGPSAGDQALRAFKDLLARLELNPSKKPFMPRHPLALSVWAALIALWVSGAYWAKSVGDKYQNPKLPPPPKSVPPDFFFPFVISRSSSLQECAYDVLTRQKQHLTGYFNYEREIYVVGSFYAALLFHFCWSVLGFAGKGAMVTNALLVLPGGRLWASAPELFFAVTFLAGLSMYFDKKQVLRLYDAQSNFLMEAKKDVFYCLIRDGKGKEIARLVKRGGLAARTWDFVDTDNQIVFTIKDDYPSTHLLRKIFGRQGGSLRAHYGVFAGERRAGFVFLDPTSVNRFQIHLDFAFARLAHPAQMLVSVLYIISKENDPFYPSLG